MMKKHCFNLFFILLSVLVSCKTEKKEQYNAQKELENRYNKLLLYKLDSLAFPRSYSHKKGKIKTVASRDWTSGFFPGNLWLIYKLIGKDAYKERAKAWTSFIEKEKLNAKTHDMGFKVYSSFGNGFQITGNEHYKNVLVQSAKTLTTRFNENIGSIRSWDHHADVWQFPVIIDNMMNLELLFEATKISGDSIYHNIAVKHANTTLKNHFRQDGSTWHVLVYDTISGQPTMKVTHQGIHDNSAWARGQGWAINGFTMAYRYTKDSKYLERAKATANFFINHKNMPEDGIPYWDFDDPAIPNAPRDVSAATIVASGLVELYGYTQNEAYLNYSKKVVTSIKSAKYVLPESLEVPFILDHSSGDWSKRSEMDEPIVYGDYYFLETLIRLNDLEEK